MLRNTICVKCHHVLQVTPSCHSERSAAKPRNLWLQSSQLTRLGADAFRGPIGPFSLKTVHRTVFRALEPKDSSAALRYARNDRTV
jgi:hypothetical protein